MALYADGSIRDVTALVTTWTSSRPEVAPVSSSGLVTGRRDGDVQIRAAYDGLEGSWQLYVTDFFQGASRLAGADEITGWVRELTPTWPVEVRDAVVEIVGGPQHGQTTVTNSEGFFRLTGLTAPGFDVVVRQSGYTPARFHVDELGRDYSSQAVLTLAPGMMSAMVEGRVCQPRATISAEFTPALPGPIRITRFLGDAYNVTLYANGVLIDKCVCGFKNYQAAAGVAYELRIGGKCDYGAPDGGVIFLRPR
jgi:hypothetical protein